ncbi:hypothetical protein ACFQH6_00425 [Halobacteriaceae archaeon GCM10025711]
MSQTDSIDVERAPSRRTKLLRGVAWTFVAVLGVALLVGFPVAVVVTVGAYVTAVPLSQSLPVVGGLAALAVGFWGAVWLVDDRELADWNRESPSTSWED